MDFIKLFAKGFVFWMQMVKFTYQEIVPDQRISQFVRRFWKFTNTSIDVQNYTILPDGFFDLIETVQGNKLKRISLVGLCTREMETAIEPRTTILGVSFKPLAAEYILQRKIAALLNGEKRVPNGFYNIDKIPFRELPRWAGDLTTTFEQILKNGKLIDGKKLKLFNLLFETKGSLTVSEIAKQVSWSGRQMNRYFNEYYGLSLKSYSTILRSKSAYNTIKSGNLHPPESFADQAHFIREIKKRTGVTPKVLSKNKNDRFIQFSTRPE